MVIYRAEILKEKDTFYLNIASIDGFSSSILSKIREVVTFIQNNLYESQLAWHVTSNTPLLEITAADDGSKIFINSPYLKFLYNIPMWKMKLKNILSEVSKEISSLIEE
ncbi:MULTISPECIES: hypothetical protein [Clostridium]|jgi:hypothetical protein|uniref:hypothetical protein n=1 Tax=Clostridium TaxID=1485 RepID=UPI00242AB07E|nr:hypothetical protein [Clostridium tyrobutyricum]